MRVRRERREDDPMSSAPSLADLIGLLHDLYFVDVGARDRGVYRNARSSDVMNWIPDTDFRLSRSSLVMKRSIWAAAAHAS